MTRQEQCGCVRCLFTIVLVLSSVQVYGAGENATNFTNVAALQSFGNSLVFVSLNRNAAIYECELASRKPFAAHSDRNIERGKAILHITKVFRGIRRSDIVVPYSFERPSGGGSSEGPLVWPALDHLRENERLLCIIVPGAEDPSTARIEGADEAASMVEVVTGRSDPKIQEIQTICHMYGTKGTPQFARELRNALSDSRPGVRDFALQVTAINLGETAPDEAIEILRTRTAAYSTDAAGAEGVELISFLERMRGEVEPWEKMDPFICRCLVTLAQSRSKMVRERALAALAGTITFFDYHPGVRLQDGLNASEKRALRNIVNSEISAAGTGESAQAPFLSEWLAQ